MVKFLVLVKFGVKFVVKNLRVEVVSKITKNTLDYMILEQGGQQIPQF